MADAGIDLHILQRAPAIRIRQSRLATCIPTCRPCWTLELRFGLVEPKLVRSGRMLALSVIEGVKNVG
jgi:hypothetical protein